LETKIGKINIHLLVESKEFSIQPSQKQLYTKKAKQSRPTSLSLQDQATTTTVTSNLALPSFSLSTPWFRRKTQGYHLPAVVLKNFLYVILPEKKTNSRLLYKSKTASLPSHKNKKTTKSKRIKKNKKAPPNETPFFLSHHT